MIDTIKQKAAEIGAEIKETAQRVAVIVQSNWPVAVAAVVGFIAGRIFEVL